MEISASPVEEQTVLSRWKHKSSTNSILFRRRSHLPSEFRRFTASGFYIFPGQATTISFHSTMAEFSNSHLSQVPALEGELEESHPNGRGPVVQSLYPLDQWCIDSSNPFAGESSNTRQSLDHGSNHSNWYSDLDSDSLALKLLCLIPIQIRIVVTNLIGIWNSNLKKIVDREGNQGKEE